MEMNNKDLFWTSYFIMFFGLMISHTIEGLVYEFMSTLVGMIGWFFLILVFDIPGGLDG